MEEKDIHKLYDSQSLLLMRTADEAQVRGENRVQEIKSFARKVGIKRIGIAHCIVLAKEAAVVKDFLNEEFEVYSIDCKIGRISKLEMLQSEGSAIMCNPAGQAAFLQEHNTELNITMGLCVGHDMVFNQKSAVPVSTLVVKDRVNKHNPMESIKAIIPIP